MKKRLRKKKHLGEFTEYGRYFKIRTTNKTNELGQLEDDFIDMLEKNNMSCGGGLGRVWDIYIELGKKDVMWANLNLVRRWLRKNDNIIEYCFGLPFDIWNETNLDKFEARGDNITVYCYK